MQLTNVLKDILDENSPHNNFTLHDTVLRIYGHLPVERVRSVLHGEQFSLRNKLLRTVGLDDREKFFTDIHEILYPKPINKKSKSTDEKKNVNQGNT